jgi:hypothetical protein
LICASAGVLLAQAPTVTAVVNSQIQTSTVLCPGLLATLYGTGFGSGATTSVVVLVGGEERLYRRGDPESGERTDTFRCSNWGHHCSCNHGRRHFGSI